MSVYYENNGKYWAKVTNQGLGVTSTGKPQFVLSFTILGKVNPQDPEGALISCEQYERSMFRTITDKTVEWLLDDIKHLCQRGNLAPDISGFEQLDPKTPGFLNLANIEFEAFCQHDTYEGKTRERWSVSTGGGGGLEIKPLDNTEVRKLNAMFGKQLKRLSNGAPKTPASPEPPKESVVPMRSPANTPDDEIPF